MRSGSIAVVALAVAGCGMRADRGRAAKGPPPMPVQTAIIKPVPLRDESTYVATLRSRQSVQVQPQVDGHITRIDVTSGDRVEPRTVLMQIDPARQKAAVSGQRALREGSQATLANARTELARAKRMYAGGVVTKQYLERAETQFRQAEANAVSAAAQEKAGAVELGYTAVTAPSNGTVGDIPVRVGDFVTPQTTLTTIDDNDVLEAYINVPIERAAALTEATPVEILDREGNVLATSTVTFISPRADPGTQMLLIKARIDNANQRLRSWQLVGARVIWGERQGVVAPVVAVQTRAGQSFVWVVRRGPAGLVADLRPVELGPVQGQNYAIRKGLKADEQIVVSGVQKLRPGAPIAPMPPGAGGAKPGEAKPGGSQPGG